LTRRAVSALGAFVRLGRRWPNHPRVGIDPHMRGGSYDEGSSVRRVAPMYSALGSTLADECRRGSSEARGAAATGLRGHSPAARAGVARVTELSSVVVTHLPLHARAPARRGPRTIPSVGEPSAKGLHAPGDERVEDDGYAVTGWGSGA